MFFLTSSLRHPRIFIKYFSMALRPFSPSRAASSARNLSWCSEKVGKAHNIIDELTLLFVKLKLHSSVKSSVFFTVVWTKRFCSSIAFGLDSAFCNAFLNKCCFYRICAHL